MPNFNWIFIITAERLSQIPTEYAEYLKYAPIFVIGLLSALILTPIIGAIASRYDIKNDTKSISNNKLNKHENNNRRIKDERVPLLGGLAVIIPLLLLILFIFGVNPFTGPILLAILLLTISGIIDDVYNLPATIQFLLQFIASLLIATTVIHIDLIHIPFDGTIDLNWLTYQWEVLNIPVTLSLPLDILLVFWIMTCINAVKWVSGLDALMEFNMMVAFFFIFVIASRSDILFVIFVSAFLTGSITGFTFYNFPPAKILSASTGKTLYGFLVALLAILTEAKLALTIMILLLPLIDFLFVIIKRFIRLKPRKPRDLLKAPRILAMSDTNHIHHKLLSLGLSTKQILLIETSVTLLIGSVAVLTTEAYRLFFLLIAAVIVICAILFVHILSKKRRLKSQKPPKDRSREDSPESRYSY